MVKKSMWDPTYDPTYLDDEEIKALKAGEKLKAKKRSGRPAKKEKDVPFVETTKSKVYYCDNCIERDGEEYKDQTCSYRLPPTANKSQYYRNHIAKNECPNCHESLELTEKQTAWTAPELAA